MAPLTTGGSVLLILATAIISVLSTAAAAPTIAPPTTVMASLSASASNLLIHEDREYLKYCMEEIRKKCKEYGFVLNEKKTKIAPLRKGVKFLKTKFFLNETGAIIRKMNRKSPVKMRKKLRIFRFCGRWMLSTTVYSRTRRIQDMVKFLKNGSLLALVEQPSWVYLQENGAYGLCDYENAQGVAINGIVYNLAGNLISENGEVDFKDIPSGEYMMQQDKVAAQNAANVDYLSMMTGYDLPMEEQAEAQTVSVGDIEGEAAYDDTVDDPTYVAAEEEEGANE